MWIFKICNLPGSSGRFTSIWTSKRPGRSRASSGKFFDFFYKFWYQILKCDILNATKHSIIVIIFLKEWFILRRFHISLFPYQSYLFCWSCRWRGCCWVDRHRPSSRAAGWQPCRGPKKSRPEKEGFHIPFKISISCAPKSLTFKFYLEKGFHMSSLNPN